MFTWSIYRVSPEIINLIRTEMWKLYTVNWYWYYLDVRVIRYGRGFYELFDIDDNMICSFQV